ncbi:hypothetical protein HDU86_007324 [Geranomyces michiganensis]|nr:hypothetical protein HDU86_007324 [Geranomyces michiganensis]
MTVSTTTAQTIYLLAFPLAGHYLPTLRLAARLATDPAVSVTVATSACLEDKLKAAALPGVKVLPLKDGLGPGEDLIFKSWRMQKMQVAPIADAFWAAVKENGNVSKIVIEFFLAHALESRPDELKDLPVFSFYPLSVSATLKGFLEAGRSGKFEQTLATDLPKCSVGPGWIHDHITDAAALAAAYADGILIDSFVDFELENFATLCGLPPLSCVAGRKKVAGGKQDSKRKRDNGMKVEEVVDTAEQKSGAELGKTKDAIPKADDAQIEVSAALAEAATRVRLIGPLFSSEYLNPSTDDTTSVALSEADQKVLDFLSKQADASVLYISFGSHAPVIAEQTMQIAEALLKSTSPFVWGLRVTAGLPADFTERTQGRGIVLGWAPQHLILSHRATGVFITHAGWNSVLEAVATGTPMVCWPLFGDQCYNAELVSIRNIGVVVSGASIDMCEYPYKADRIVPADEINEAIAKIDNAMRDAAKALAIDAVRAAKNIADKGLGI